MLHGTDSLTDRQNTSCQRNAVGLSEGLASLVRLLVYLTTFSWMTLTVRMIHTWVRHMDLVEAAILITLMIMIGIIGENFGLNQTEVFYSLAQMGAL